GHPERPALECWTSLTALAQRTERLRFGPLVSPITFRHPALLARMAAAVDGLSNARHRRGLERIGARGLWHCAARAEGAVRPSRGGHHRHQGALDWRAGRSGW